MAKDDDFSDSSSESSEESDSGDEAESGVHDWKMRPAGEEITCQFCQKPISETLISFVSTDDACIACKNCGMVLHMMCMAFAGTACGEAGKNDAPARAEANQKAELEKEAARKLEEKRKEEERQGEARKQEEEERQKREAEQDAERKKQEEERKQLEKERRKLDEDRRKLEEDRRKLGEEEERKKREEEERRKEAERKRKEEEERKREEEERRAEERRKKEEEERKRKEEERRAEERRKKEEEERKEEEGRKKEEEKRKLEEEEEEKRRKKEEEERKRKEEEEERSKKEEGAKHKKEEGLSQLDSDLEALMMLAGAEPESESGSEGSESVGDIGERAEVAASPEGSTAAMSLDDMLRAMGGSLGGTTDSEPSPVVVTKDMDKAEAIERAAVAPVPEKKMFGKGMYSLYEKACGGSMISRSDAQIGAGGSHVFVEGRFPMTTYCNVCGGLLRSRDRAASEKTFCCERCMYFVHENCRFDAPEMCKCGYCHPDNAGKPFKHVWVEGNLADHDTCTVCRKEINAAAATVGLPIGLTGVRCIWCRRVCHHGCSGSLSNPDCDLGYFMAFVFPPNSIMVDNAAETVQLRLPEQINPVVFVFCDAAMPNALGTVEKFRGALNPLQVFLFKGEDELSAILETLPVNDFKTRKLNFAVAGGPSSVTTFHSALDGMRPRPPVAIAGLDPARNDLSYSLGFGSESLSDFSSVLRFLNFLKHSSDAQVDRWVMSTLDERGNSHRTVMTSYFTVACEGLLNPDKSKHKKEKRSGFGKSSRLLMDQRATPIANHEGVVLTNAAVFCGVDSRGSGQEVDPDEGAKRLFDGHLEVIGIQSGAVLKKLLKGEPAGSNIGLCMSAEFNLPSGFSSVIDVDGIVKRASVVAISLELKDQVTMLSLPTSMRKQLPSEPARPQEEKEEDGSGVARVAFGGEKEEVPFSIFAVDPVALNAFKKFLSDKKESHYRNIAGFWNSIEKFKNWNVAVRMEQYGLVGGDEGEKKKKGKRDSTKWKEGALVAKKADVEEMAKLYFNSGASMELTRVSQTLRKTIVASIRGQFGTFIDDRVVDPVWGEALNLLETEYFTAFKESDLGKKYFAQRFFPVFGNFNMSPYYEPPNLTPVPYLRGAIQSHYLVPHRFSSTAGCNICGKSLTKGLQCIICKFAGHLKCLHNAPLTCKRGWCPEWRPEFTLVPHHWVYNTLNASMKCCACKKPFRKRVLNGLKCSWCQRVCHSKCLLSYHQMCDLGEFQCIIVPPTHIAFPSEESLQLKVFPVPSVCGPGGGGGTRTGGVFDATMADSLTSAEEEEEEAQWGVPTELSSSVHLSSSPTSDSMTRARAGSSGNTPQGPSRPQHDDPFGERSGAHPSSPSAAAAARRSSIGGTSASSLGFMRTGLAGHRISGGGGLGLGLGFSGGGLSVSSVSTSPGMGSFLSDSPSSDSSGGRASSSRVELPSSIPAGASPFQNSMVALPRPAPRRRGSDDSGSSGGNSVSSFLSTFSTYNLSDLSGPRDDKDSHGYEPFGVNPLRKPFTPTLVFVDLWVSGENSVVEVDHRGGVVSKDGWKTAGERHGKPSKANPQLDRTKEEARKLAKFLMSKFMCYLNPMQVYELVDAVKLRKDLRMFRGLSDLRIIVAAHGSAVALVESMVDELDFKYRPTIGVLPIGRQVDLAKVLGWGRKVISISSVLRSLDQNEIVSVDRWQVEIQGLEFEHTFTMVTCFSLGVDANMLEAHAAGRDFNPVHVKSRKLQNVLNVTVDGNVMTSLPPVAGVVFSNLWSYLGGVNVWGTAYDQKFNPPSFNDGLLEMSGFRGPMHLMKVAKAKSTSRQSGVRIAQAREFEISFADPNGEEIALQIDGLSWTAKLIRVRITRKDQVPMFAQSDEMAKIRKQYVPTFEEGMSKLRSRFDNISLEEINQKLTFEKLMVDPVGLDYFKRHLVDCFNEESLLFHQELEQFRKLATPENGGRAAANNQIYNEAQRLYLTYVAVDSEMEINVEDGLRRSVMLVLKDPAKVSTSVFDDAGKSISRILKYDSFPKFIVSDHAKEYYALHVDRQS